ncbi:MAG TPA: undecaprenyldiphospho-muramoylpentapeptide beta-N-acetylglucosaminyltransferase [Gammaproteobacteria bacterium]|nr:undecaprenyldiphospho-muramoylpentapeptide beta-N-acetylglucosaminyltransferase [Gammaproteobacteria bacterium]HIN89133.1 undecaprenyldiphospho-muramoylpentapeptide beta-N-acetylglucosaminyltransferase [Porticoccaceae bacterium]
MLFRKGSWIVNLNPVADNTSILIMAAGTGGHIFPALSIAQKLAAKGVRTEWLGTRNGMENELLAGTDIAIHTISVQGLRGKGIARKLMAPFMLVQALVQSIVVISRVKPLCVLGMGGFVSGPGGIAAKLMGRRLLIHEQNAVAGATNKILAKFADRVFEAFPNTFAKNEKVIHTGNPLREDIVAIAKGIKGSNSSASLADAPLQILVLGGSQGAAAINAAIPEVLSRWGGANRPEIYHQSGSKTFDETRKLYQSLNIEFGDGNRLVPFIDDMAAAYRWADLVVSRSGASTVSELAAVGLPSILIPYPYHSDNQQTANAEWLSDNRAAVLIRQAELTIDLLLRTLKGLDDDRIRLRTMAERASSIALRDASELIATLCLESDHV